MACSPVSSDLADSYLGSAGFVSIVGPVTRLCQNSLDRALAAPLRLELAPKGTMRGSVEENAIATPSRRP